MKMCFFSYLLNSIGRGVILHSKWFYRLKEKSNILKVTNLTLIRDEKQ